jgi:hypothetical protein
MAQEGLSAPRRGRGLPQRLPVPLFLILFQLFQVLPEQLRQLRVFLCPGPIQGFHFGREGGPKDPENEGLSSGLQTPGEGQGEMVRKSGALEKKARSKPAPEVLRITGKLPLEYWWHETCSITLLQPFNRKRAAKWEVAGLALLAPPHPYLKKKEMMSVPAHGN